MIRRDPLTPTPPSTANSTFAITQVRLDNDGRIADVWWSPVDAESHLSGESSTRVPVSAVVRAIRAGTSVISRAPGSGGEAGDRCYVVTELAGGHPTIVLEDAIPRRGVTERAVLLDPEDARTGSDSQRSS